MKFNAEKLKEYAPIILRIGIALVFLWFAISQFSAPKHWVGYLPLWTAHSFMPQLSFIYLNAIAEIVFGTLLLLGIFTRISATILGLHLLAITIAVGYDSIGVRDFGLTLATLSIALHGADKWCILKNDL